MEKNYIELSKVENGKTFFVGDTEFIKFNDSYNAWKNHISHGNCYGLAKAMDNRINKYLGKECKSK